MNLFNSIAATSAVKLTIIAADSALASNIKTGQANGSEIHSLQNAESSGVDYLTMQNAPSGDHRVIVNYTQRKIL